MNFSLSILIPVFNHNCTLLLDTLHNQAKQMNIDFEIVLAEDGSTSIYNYDNLNIPHLRHIIRKENVGRSAIRNFLFGCASYPNILMMDCDVSIQPHDFLRKYVDAALQHDIVCGGLIYPSVSPAKEFRMRYDYEKKYETKIKRKGYSCPQPFRSSCFFIRKTLTDSVHFDERFKRYGYEDVKFGKDLREAGFTPYYIYNPVINTYIEPNDIYIKKLQESLETLYEFRDDLRSESRLLRVAETIHKWHLDWTVNYLPIKEGQYSKYVQKLRLLYLLKIMNHE